MTTNTSRALQWTVCAAAAAVILCLCLLILRPFFSVIGWSVVLAITCYPLHERLVRRTRRATLSAALTSVVMAMAVIVPLLFIAGIAGKQILALGSSLREALLNADGIAQRVSAAVAGVTGRFGLDANAITTWADGHSSEWIARAGEATLSVAAGAGGALLSFVLTAVGTFLLLRHGERVVAAILDLLPFERTRSEALLGRIRDVVHASMHGVAAIATIQGVLCGGMFWLLGIPAAALWGLVTGFASMVPLVGTAAVWVPGTLYLLATGAWAKAIVLLVWGAAVVSSVDNVLRPRLVADRVHLSGIAMFVAMLGGLQAFGALGIILGPVTFAAAAALVQELRETQPPSPLRVAARQEQDVA